MSTQSMTMNNPKPGKSVSKKASGGPIKKPVAQAFPGKSISKKSAGSRPSKNVQVAPKGVKRVPLNTIASADKPHTVGNRKGHMNYGES